ncbi:MAG: CaiB/BaiF CoA-transferase family protein [Pseudomonadota bacterium]
MAGDLDGLLVVSLDQAVAAPYCAARLADAGARVIKVERPEGDFARAYERHAKGHSGHFVWLNRGKESIALDLKDPADAGVLRALVAEADVFLENLAPGALARLGFGHEALRAARPELITCSISGYGSEGPRASQKAYDLLVQAETGLSSVTGTPEGPARAGISVCDIAAGVTAHAAILQALFARSRTGAGRHVEVSLFHALADWMNVPYLHARYGEGEPGRPGLKHPSLAPYGAFECGDGRALLISIQNEREWARFCADILGEPGLATAEGWNSSIARVANRAAVDGRVQTVFAGAGREEMIARLQAAGIAFGRLSSLQDLIAHPQARFVTVRAGEAEIEVLAPGAVVAGAAPLRPGPAPGLDAHGAAIRAEFGAA